MKTGRFTVLYRWRLREGSERKFVDAWTEVTEYHLANSGSFGSRLHKGNDGTWYAYAQWPSQEARQRAFSGDELEGAADAMSQCVEERFPEVLLSVESDLLR
ncbi:MAG: antibiotic biosynthesis monooxygenase [Acidobacteriota bacterium]|nr:MAG: antibiotic biosynthesis monooxygenase [Acidobacteriota bacterium]